MQLWGSIMRLLIYNSVAMFYTLQTFKNVNFYSLYCHQLKMYIPNIRICQNKEHFLQVLRVFRLLLRPLFHHVNSCLKSASWWTPMGVKLAILLTDFTSERRKSDTNSNFPTPISWSHEDVNYIYSYMTHPWQHATCDCRPLKWNAADSWFKYAMPSIHPA